MSNYQTETSDGTQIKVVGVPEIPSINGTPSNKQLHSGIKEAHSTLEQHKPRLNEHGKSIVDNTQNVLGSTSTLLKKKNKEERWQRLFVFTRESAKEGPSDGLTEAARNLMNQATGMGGKASNNATDVTSYVRETILNLATSPEFRELAVELLSLLQALLGQASSEIDDTKTEVKTKENPIAAQKSKSKKLKARVRSEDEQTEIIRDRLNVFLRHVGRQPEYQSLVKNFLKYSEQIYETLYEAKDEHAKTKEAEDLNKLLAEAWEILGDFAGRELVLKFRANLKHYLNTVKADKELREWTRESKKLLILLMENPEKVDSYNDKISSTIKQGRKILSKHSAELNRLYNEAMRIFTKIRTDPSVKDFQRSLKALGRNLTLNNQGQPDLFIMEESMSQIKNLFVEMARGLLVDVPIERIEVHNDDIDLALADITIKGAGMMPGGIHVKMSSVTDFNLQKSPEAEHSFILRLRISQVKPEFKNVRFGLEKKTFPKYSDNGVANLIFEGDGISATATIAVRVESGALSRAKVRSTNVTVDTVRLVIDKEKTKHDILDSMFSGMVANRLRTKMQTSLENYMNTRLEQIVGQMNDWFATKPFQNMKVKSNESLQNAHQKKRVRSQKKVERKEDKEHAKKTASEIHQKRKSQSRSPRKLSGADQHSPRKTGSTSPRGHSQKEKEIYVERADTVVVTTEYINPDHHAQKVYTSGTIVHGDAHAHPAGAAVVHHEEKKVHHDEKLGSAHPTTAVHDQKSVSAHPSGVHLEEKKAHHDEKVGAGAAVHHEEKKGHQDENLGSAHDSKSATSHRDEKLGAGAHHEEKKVHHDEKSGSAHPTAAVHQEEKKAHHDEKLGAAHDKAHLEGAHDIKTHPNYVAPDHSQTDVKKVKSVISTDLHQQYMTEAPAEVHDSIVDVEKAEEAERQRRIKEIQGSETAHKSEHKSEQKSEQKSEHKTDKDAHHDQHKSVEKPHHDEKHADQHKEGSASEQKEPHRPQSPRKADSTGSLASVRPLEEQGGIPQQ